MRNTNLITAKHLFLREYLKQSSIAISDDQNPWITLLRESIKNRDLLLQLLNNPILHPTPHELLTSVDNVSSTNGLYWLICAINDLITGGSERRELNEKLIVLLTETIVFI